MYPAAESVTRDTRTKHASPHKSFTVSAFERTLLPSAQDKKNWLHCSGTWTYLFMDSSRLIHRKGEFSSCLMSEYASSLDSMFCTASLTSRVSLTISPCEMGFWEEEYVHRQIPIYWIRLFYSFLTPQLLSLREFPSSVWTYGVHVRFPTWSVYWAHQKLCII